jgi:hypothetical protein
LVSDRVLIETEKIDFGLEALQLKKRPPKLKNA